MHSWKSTPPGKLTSSRALDAHHVNIILDEHRCPRTLFFSWVNPSAALTRKFVCKLDSDASPNIMDDWNEDNLGDVLNDLDDLDALDDIDSDAETQVSGHHAAREWALIF